MPILNLMLMFSAKNSLRIIKVTVKAIWLLLFLITYYYLLAKETELRQIRKEISAIDDKAAPIVERIGHLHAEIRKEEKSAEKKRVAERERLMVEWVRKMIPELQRAKILEELGLSITSTPEEFIEVMESYYDDEITMGKLRSAFNKFYLPINAEG